ncbi:efflux RND transporter permease subunit [Marinomonas pollencensis]|uniref:Multidrug efflux pump n=1 Tax=Marinomonas pollencensis TaxID=491954 RepID=A0A3E0DM81_9GAMM|nr:efflux RND transporter permease subunit [Marinomonas pollencensis]REG83871.1 multidrug efflux pump [Marinomonas pollencensis]
MNLSRVFIFRPVATWLITMAIMLLGILGFQWLPVASLPAISTPMIEVSANLSGASPEVMATTVATPLERALGQISGVSEMTSSSSQGTTSIVMVFDNDKDINGAAREVQAAINAAKSLLPSAMTSSPTYRKRNPSAAPIFMLSLTSPSLAASELYDFASNQLEPRIAQIQGVSEVSLLGSALPAVRIDLHPQALTHYGISLDTVRKAIVNATDHQPKGILQGEKNTWMVNTNDQLLNAKQFADLIIYHQDGVAIQLSDVAQVSDGVENRFNVGYYNNQPAINIGVTQSSGSNMLSTIDDIKAQLPMFNKLLPKDASLNIVLDRSPTVRSALHETERTLLIAMALVIAVVFVFLRNGRALLIPAMALPVSLLGTFAVMYLLGYSLDNLSLMALIVSTGFVVDDAIVVLENTSRHIEEGLGPVRAALKGAKEVGFTVLAMTVSLIAVFIPLLFMNNMIGQLLREFAVTLSVALVISMLVSLTLTPMLCSRMLRRQTQTKTAPWFYRIIESWFSKLQSAYQISLDFILTHKRLTMLTLLATIFLNLHLYSTVQKGFFPNQDTGILFGALRADQNTSFAAMEPRLRKYSQMIQNDPAVAGVMSSISSARHGSRNIGQFFVRLKPIDERQATASQVANRLYKQAQQLADGSLFLRAASDIHVGGRSANASYQLSLQSDNLDTLRAWAPKVKTALSKLPQLSGVDSDLQEGGQEVQIVIDRAAATRLGVSVDDFDTLLSNAFSQRQITTLYKASTQYHVVMGLTSDYTSNSDVLNYLNIVNDQGDVIPISEFTHLESGNASLSVAHQDLSATVTIAFNTADGSTLETAQQAIKTELARLALPSTIVANYAGSAQLSQAFANSLPWLILAALLSVYLILGMLYESFAHPLTILSTLPSAGLGALLLMQITNTQLTVVAFIGILLLIGIVKKNAIMMIDFALDAQRRLGLCAKDAIREACLKRFRPIMMTSFAAFFGALPMALDSGGDADLRSPLGIAICGGLLVSQILTLYTTPVVYLYMERISAISSRLWKRLIRPEEATQGEGRLAPAVTKDKMDNDE